MSKGLTDIAIRNLKAGNARREIPDPGCAGLYVIVQPQPSGKKSFALRYRFNGQPKKLTLVGGLTLAAARKLASDALLDLEQGRDPAERKKTAKQKAATAKAETVQWCCEQYLKREGDKLRTADERKRTFERLVYPEIGNVPLATLKRSHIVRMLDKIEDESGERMADATLAYLRKALNWQASRVDDFNSPIVRGMGRYDAKANRGERVLSDDEIRKLWALIEPNEKPRPFHALIRFLLLTGARRDEAREMKWTEVSATDWKLPANAAVGRNKVQLDLTRPLSKPARAVLDSLPVIDGGEFVFSNDGVTAISDSKPMRRLRTACGFKEHWKTHDLRRTARTLLSRAGIDHDTAERCTGHVIAGVRGVYDKHKYHAEMKRAYEALASLIERIVSPPANVVTPMRRKARQA